eukprot:5735246-Pyramimonas_sp.AAC.1
MANVRATGGFPARYHFPLQAEVGARPRGRQVCILRGPVILPVGPQAKPSEHQDEGEDGEIVFDIARGGPGHSWTDLLRQEARWGFGGPQTHLERIDLLCKQLYSVFEKELVSLVKPDDP